MQHVKIWRWLNEPLTLMVNNENYAQWAPTWPNFFWEIFQIKIKMFLMAA